MARCKYRNEMAKAILETECEISGGDWEKVKARGGKGKNADNTASATQAKPVGEGNNDE